MNEAHLCLCMVALINMGLFFAVDLYCALFARFGDAGARRLCAKPWFKTCCRAVHVALACLAVALMFAV